MTTSDTYERIRTSVQIILAIFFRRFQVVGLDNIPSDRGGLLIAWHPNGMIDPALIFAHFPYRLIFAARHGLFSWPILGNMLRSIGTIPVYRKRDLRKLAPELRAERNQDSLNALSQAIAMGSFSAIFPEGISHDKPNIQRLHTGAARIYYRARQQQLGKPTPAIIPVGLHYDKKHAFRSKAMVVFHPPIQLPTNLNHDSFSDANTADQRAQELTQLIEHELTEVICATESWEKHTLFFQASRLLHAEQAQRQGLPPSEPTMREQVDGLSAIWKGYQQYKKQYPQKLNTLLDDIKQYNLKLDSLGLRSHELDIDRSLLTSRILLQFLIHLLLLVFILPPLLAIGYIVNFPTAFALNLLADIYSSKGKDIASVKTFGGLVLFPLTWIIWSTLSAWGYTQSYLPQMSNSFILAFSSSFFLCILSAIVLFTYVGFAKRTLLSIRMRLTKSARKTCIASIKAKRTQLFEQIKQLQNAAQHVSEATAVPSQQQENQP